MVTMPDIIRAMVPVIAAVDGVNACHYPGPKIVNQRCEVILYWDGDLDSDISDDLGKTRMWTQWAKGHLITPLKGNPAVEFALIDDLITPITDAFDIGTVTQIMPSLGGAVDRCKLVKPRPSRVIDYAGHQYYGAELYWSIKFHRRAGG